MEKTDLMKLATETANVETLIANEKRLIESVKTHVENQIGVGIWTSSDKVQNMVNKCVNSFAATLREEIGLMDSEMAKMLERVRLVSASTVLRDKKKNEKTKQ